MQQYTQFALKDNAEAQLDSNIGASTLSIILSAGQGALFPQPYSGTTTSGGSSTTLNKTGIGSSGIAAGDFIENTTDGSHAYVVSVSTDSLTTTELQGGSDNTWQNADGYLVNAFIGTLNKRNVDTGAVTAYEKVKIIGRSTDSLTVDPSGRGYDSSTAQSFVADDYFNLFVTAKPLQEMRKAFADICQQLDLKASISYVQSSLSARTWKDPVVVATTAAQTLATDFKNGDTIDGVVLATGDRVLIKDQAAAAENGIYTVNASGAPTRATDFDATAEVTGAAVTVIQGSSNADTAWICTSDSPTIGSSAINFAQIGASITKASQAEAEAGTDDAKYMTPLKTNQAINALQNISDSAAAVLTGGGAADEEHVHYGTLGKGDYYCYPLAFATAVATVGHVSNSIYLNSAYTDSDSTTDKYVYAILNSATTCPLPSVSALIFECNFIFNGTAGDNVDYCLGVHYGTDSGTAYNAPTQQCIQIALDGSSNTLYTRTRSAGGVVTNTSLGAYTRGTVKRVKVIATADSIKYYIDGVLIVTQTANLPTISTLMAAGYSCMYCTEHEVSAVSNNHSFIVYGTVFGFK